MDQSARDWCQDGLHLPKFMRDFHDQKDLFKTIQETFSNEPPVDWVSGQVYVVDWFLWFMALHGYTLQRTRKRAEFRDIDERIADANKRRRSAFSEMLEKEMERSNG
jgi:hypothetical protein